MAGPSGHQQLTSSASCWLPQEVNDAAWCPANATVFAAAAGNTLQLWDLEHSVLRHAFPHLARGRDCPCLLLPCLPSPAALCSSAEPLRLRRWPPHGCRAPTLRRPRSSLTRYGVRMTCCVFCPGPSPVLAVGADDGSVAVYSVAGLYREGASAEEEAGRLEAALRASVLQQLGTAE